MNEQLDAIPRDIETLVFERSLPDFKRLKDFGFQEENGRYVWSCFFHDGEFQAFVSVDKSGKVSGTVHEVEMGEEYLPLRVASQTSAFVSTIRQEYYDLLISIKDHCFIDRLYVGDQACRMHEYLMKTFRDPYDHPFQKDPSSVTYRAPSNQKWYALVMRIDCGKLDETRQDRCEIVNLKQPESEIEKLVCEPGIYPCWHMNRKNWVSIILDDTVSDRRLFALLNKSRELVNGNGAPKAHNEWIVPANPKYYDLTKHFRLNHISEWKQSVRAAVGDTVYIYTAAPYSAILYKTEVVETDIPNHYSDRHIHMNRLMKLKVLKIYPPELLTMKVLRAFGVRSMQGSKRVPLELKKVIDSLNDIE